MDDVLLQYGAVGVLALVSIAAVRVLFKRLADALDRETLRADKATEELLSLNRDVREKYLTTISDATRAISDALAAVRKR